MNEEPNAERAEVLAVGPQQPPPDQRLIAIAMAAWNASHAALERLRAFQDFEPDSEPHYVWIWQLALCALSWDVTEAAIGICVAGPLRAGRPLNRSLFEYALRAHYYKAKPSAAKTDALATENLVRRTMKATVAHGGAGPAIAFFKNFFSAGTTGAIHPKTRDMIKALVVNIMGDAPQAMTYIDRLDDEYSLSTAFAHGSQVAFLDLIDGGTGQVHPRTRSLTCSDELLRATTCGLAMLAAFEVTYNQDFGRNALIEQLRAVWPFDNMTTLARQNALRQLFGL